MQTAISDIDLIEGILSHKSQALRYLYNSMYGQIESFVLKNNGSQDEAKDVFQEGMIALYQNLVKGSYQKEQTTRLSSYFFQICKFKWYSTLRSAHKRKMQDSLDHQVPGEYDIGFESDTATWDENKAIRQAMNHLGDACRRLLTSFYYDEKSMKQIADELGQQTNSVKNAKYRCMQKLKELMKNKPR